MRMSGLRSIVRISEEDALYTQLTMVQWWISTITSTFSTDRSPSSAPRSHVPR